MLYTSSVAGGQAFFCRSMYIKHIIDYRRCCEIIVEDQSLISFMKRLSDNLNHEFTTGYPDRMKQ